MSEVHEILRGLDTRWVLAILLLVLDVWAVALIWKARPPRREAVLWSAIVLLCPVVGCWFWYVLGPKPLPSREAGERVPR
jgi:hypothetical protein